MFEHLDDDPALTDWITGPVGEERLGTGQRAEWMPAGIRILHAMWEQPNADTLVTYHEDNLKAIAAGEREPRVINGKNLDEVGVGTGIPLRMSNQPESWQRLPWSEVFARVGVNPPASLGPWARVLNRYPQTGSWPMSILPPTEGTLDVESLVALASLLKSASESRLIIGYWWGIGRDEPAGLYRGSIEEIVEQSAAAAKSPNNWWPEDHAWLVWTDPDHQFSAVFGSTELIAAIEGDASLETQPWLVDMSWPRWDEEIPIADQVNPRIDGLVRVGRAGEGTLRFRPAN